MSEKLEKLLNKKELSEATGLTVSYIERAVREKDFPNYKFGSLVKFRISEVEKWIIQRKRKPKAS